MDPIQKQLEAERESLKAAAQRARHNIRKMGEGQQYNIERAGAETQQRWTEQIAARAQDVLETLGTYDYARHVNELTPKEYVESLRIINELQRTNLGMDAKDDGRPSFIVNVSAPGAAVPWMDRAALEAAERALPVIDSPALPVAPPLDALDTTKGPLALLTGNRKTTAVKPRASGAK